MSKFSIINSESYKPIFNADKIQGVNVSFEQPLDNEALVFDVLSNTYIPQPVSIGLTSPWHRVEDPNVPGQMDIALDPALPTLVNDVVVFPTASTEYVGPGPEIKFFLVTVNGSIRGGAVTGPAWDSVNRGAGSVAFGIDSIASANSTTVSGGEQNVASGGHASVGGGSTNTAIGLNSTIGGGSANIASGICATVSGGEHNTTSGSHSFIGGGGDAIAGNTASGLRAAIISGNMNTAAADDSFIASGTSNTTTVGALQSSILAGTGNTIDATGINASILCGSGLNNPEPNTALAQRLRWQGVRGAVKLVTVDTAAALDDWLFSVDVGGTVAGLTIELPVAPLNGTWYRVKDRTGTVSIAKPLTINGNGINIVDAIGVSAATLVFIGSGNSTELVYDLASNVWLTV